MIVSDWTPFQALSSLNVIESLIPIEQSETALLEWAGSRPDLFTDIKKRKIEFGSMAYWNYEVTGKNEFKRVPGIGRSSNERSAASKAVGEFLERYIAFHFFRDNRQYECADIDLRWKADSGCDPGTYSLVDLPSGGFHSSHGWAVHFDPGKAVENAIREAMERHILLFTYLKYGWSGFQAVPVQKLGDFEMVSLFSKVASMGYRAGIGATIVPGHLGAVYGYACDSAQAFETSSRWEQAFFESYEQALYFYAQTSENLKEEFSTDKDILGRAQYHHLTHPIKFELGEAVGQVEVFENQTGRNAKLILMDGAKLLDIPTPFYVAYVFGGNVIPLVFKSELSQAELAEVNSKIMENGIQEELPQWHPVI